MQEQLNTGIVERVEERGVEEVGEVHYLPHHPVVYQDKQTTKVRLATMLQLSKVETPR